MWRDGRDWLIHSGEREREGVGVDPRRWSNMRREKRSELHWKTTRFLNLKDDGSLCIKASKKKYCNADEDDDDVVRLFSFGMKCAWVGEADTISTSTI